MASTIRRWVIPLALLACTVSCSAEPEPVAPRTSTTTTTPTRTEPPDPAIILSSLTTVYKGDLGTCPPAGPQTEAACGAALTSAGKIADAMARIVEENPGITNGEKIAKAAGDLSDAVATIQRTGCYGLGTPTASPAELGQLCGTLAQSAHLGWLALSAAADGL